MKELWNRIKKWKYFKIVAAIVLIFAVVGVVYVLFIRGFLQFQRNEKLFVEGVQRYYEYNPLKLPKEGGYSEHKLSDMFHGSWVESLYVPSLGKKKLCSEDSFVRVIHENGEYRYVTYLKCGRYESKADHRAPNIILNGEDTVIVHLGNTYTDPGVKEVRDDHDKIDVSKVKVDSSKVNTSKMGSYEVTYQVSDKNYNITKMKRTVIVAETLSSHIQSEKGENFVYVGDASDNYVQFSGMLWRIVKLDQDGNLALITNNAISNVFFGDYDKEYPDSNVYKWLNDYFFSNLHENSKKYIVNTRWCYDDVVNFTDAETCSSSVEAKVGLLSVQDYRNLLVESHSYLNNQARFSMINRQSAQSIWTSDIYNGFANMNVQDLVGVRPVIHLSKDIFVTAGDGTQDSPYKLQDYTYAKENDLLNTRIIGEYIVYSGYLFRVAGVDKEGNTKLVGVGLLQNSSDKHVASFGYSSDVKVSPNVEEEGNLYYALNQDALRYISEKSIVTHEFEIPIYERNKKFDELEKKKVNSKIGLPASYEIFSGLNLESTDYQIYWLADYHEDGLVSILNGNNGIAFYLNRDTFPANGVKPVIYVKNNLKIASGRGTSRDPYYVR